MAASPPPPTRNHWLVAAAGVVLAILGAAVAYLLLRELNYVPASLDRYLVAALVGAFGVMALVFIGRALRREASDRLGPARANRVLDLYRLLAYVVLGLIVLSALGVSSTALLAGGTFAGLVIGLAAQTALGNVIAGVVLLVARPFAQGDRVTVSTWQYPFLGPAYPPKFFSDDLLILGFTGIVRSIGLTYTSLRRDDGTFVRIPNNIVIQAAVVSHEVTQRWVRTKYEVPPQIDPKELIPLVKERIVHNDWVARPESVAVSVGAATVASYVIVVDAICKGAHEEPPRSALLIELMDVVRKLRDRAPPGKS